MSNAEEREDAPPIEFSTRRAARKYRAKLASKSIWRRLKFPPKSIWIFTFALIFIIFAFVGLFLGQRSGAQIAEGALPNDALISDGAAGLRVATVVLDASLLGGLGEERGTVRPEKLEIDTFNGGFVSIAVARCGDVKGWIGNERHFAVGERNKKLNFVQKGEEKQTPLLYNDMWVGFSKEQRSVRLPLGFGSGFCAIAQVRKGERANSVQNTDAHFDAKAQGTAGSAQSESSAVFRILWEEVPHVWWVGPFFIIGFVGLIVGLSIGGFRKTFKALRLKKAQGQKGQGRKTQGRHAAFLILIFAIMPLLLSACSAAYWPRGMTGSDVRAAAPVVAEKPKSPPPVLDAERVSNILHNATQVLHDADQALSLDALKSRFCGPQLDIKRSDYAGRRANSAPIVSFAGMKDVRVVAPEAVDTWPRTVFAVGVADGSADGQDAGSPNPGVVASASAQEDTGKAADIGKNAYGVFLHQKSPKDNYKICAATQILPGIALPPFAAAIVGSGSLQNASSNLLLSPAQVFKNYAKMLESDEPIREASFFEDTDIVRNNVNGEYRKKVREGLGSSGAAAEFRYTAGEQMWGVSTLDGGAVVAGTVKEIERLKPLNANERVVLSGRAAHLANKTQSSRGFAREYLDLLFFYIPPKQDKKKVLLLGATQVLVHASEL